jgi:hypothetical protein
VERRRRIATYVMIGGLLAAAATYAAVYAIGGVRYPEYWQESAKQIALVLFHSTRLVFPARSNS